MEHNSALPDLGPIFKAAPEVCLVYLFGSRVKGVIGPLSDYDFGVLLEHGSDVAAYRDELAHALTLSLGTDRVDVVVLNKAPIELAYSVIVQGVVLYQRDLATRVDYEARVMALYEDYLPVLRQQRDDILRGEDYAKRVQRYREALGRTRRTLSKIGADHSDAQG